jgi:actin related protein 2/3 complex subunit 5
MSSSLVNWRTINIDALDPDSPANFDLSTLTPDVVPVSAADVQHLATQCRQLLRGGDSEGALRGALENAPYGGDERGKVSSHSLLGISVIMAGGRAERREERGDLLRWTMR